MDNVEKEERDKNYEKKAQRSAEEGEWKRNRAAHCALSVLPWIAAPGMEAEYKDADELLECGLEKET